MSSTPVEKDVRHCGTEYWSTRWSKGQTAFHKPDVHPFLEQSFSKLFPDGTANKVFIPLCGKSVDMKWLSDHNIPVTGLDCVPAAVEQFFTDFGIEFTQEKVSAVEGGATLFKDAADKFRIYCCDMLKFNETIDGTFDVVWDRGSLVALNREDVKSYVKVIKALMKPGGRCLLETVDFDTAIMIDNQDSPTCPPPPYPMYLDELKSLYEPECTVEPLSRMERKLAEKHIHAHAFLITKKS